MLLLVCAKSPFCSGDRVRALTATPSSLGSLPFKSRMVFLPPTVPHARVYLYPPFFQRQLPALVLHSNPSPVSCIQYIQQSTVSFESEDWVANSIVKRVITGWTTRMIGVENARVTSRFFSFLFWTERAIGAERKKGKGAHSAPHIHNCHYKHRLWFTGVSENTRTDGKAPDAPPTCAKPKTGQ